MTYLSRPVFDWPLQWVEPVESVEYDVKALTLGFGRAEFAPTARQVARGWKCEFWLTSAIAIAEYEAWSAALKGRLKGFWFPAATFAVSILGSETGGQMDVAACGLIDTWNTESRLHLYLVDLEGTKTCAVVTNVTAPSPGVERVFLDATLLNPAPGWQVHRLLYVRNVDDVERSKSRGEHSEARELTVVELPEEYLAAESGEEPIWRYWFHMTPPSESRRSWYYTSFADLFSAGGHDHLPIPINHDRITQSIDSQEETVKLTTVLKSGTPWAEMIPHVPERPLWVQISQASYASPDTATVQFTGVLKSATATGRKVEMTFAGWLDGIGRIPSRVFGAGCPFTQGDARTCKLDMAPLQLAVAFDAIAAMQVTVSGVGLVAQAANFFARGRLTTGSGATREDRMILASTAVSGGATQLTLSRPLLHAAVAGTATINQDCGHNRVGCAALGNLPNYGGFDFMPDDNPVMKGATVPGAGGKK